MCAVLQTICCYVATNCGLCSRYVVNYKRYNISYMGLVAQWFRCCATNRNVAGSIPDGVIGIFH